MTEIKDFTKRLDELIKNEGFRSLRQFALAADISYGTLSNYYKRGSLPDVETLVKISDFFGVTLDYLIKGVNPWEGQHGAETRLKKGVVIEGLKVAEKTELYKAVKDLAAIPDKDVAKVRRIMDVILEEARARVEASRKKKPEKKAGNGE